MSAAAKLVQLPWNHARTAVTSEFHTADPAGAVARDPAQRSLAPPSMPSRISSAAPLPQFFAEPGRPGTTAPYRDYRRFLLEPRRCRAVSIPYRAAGNCCAKVVDMMWTRTIPMDALIHGRPPASAPRKLACRDLRRPPHLGIPPPDRAAWQHSRRPQTHGAARRPHG